MTNPSCQRNCLFQWSLPNPSGNTHFATVQAKEKKICGMSAVFPISDEKWGREVAPCIFLGDEEVEDMQYYYLHAGVTSILIFYVINRRLQFSSFVLSFGRLFAVPSTRMFSPKSVSPWGSIMILDYSWDFYFAFLWGIDGILWCNLSRYQSVCLGVCFSVCLYPVWLGRVDSEDAARVMVRVPSKELAFWHCGRTVWARALQDGGG